MSGMLDTRSGRMPTVLIKYKMQLCYVILIKLRILNSPADRNTFCAANDRSLECDMECGMCECRPGKQDNLSERYFQRTLMTNEIWFNV